MPRSELPGSTDSGAETSMTRDCVALLLERFPHLQSVSLILLRRHETFRDLCEEYEACSQVCDRLERSHTDDALRREYAALRLRLERELLSYIEENSGSHGH